MSDVQYGARVAQRRKALRMTQTEAAARCGIARPNFAAIENGTRSAGPKTRTKIRAGLSAKPSTLLEKNRDYVLAEANKLGITNVRIFGSVARGEDTTFSDIDLLVVLPDRNKIRALTQFQESVSSRLCVKVDVLSDHNIPHLTSDALKAAKIEAVTI